MPAFDFDAPDLAAHAELASQFDLDNLPFGVIRLDRNGIVQFYSATEARLSGYGEAPLGQNLFAISHCFGGDNFRGRIALAAIPRELRIRVQSSRSGGLWVFIERNATSGRKTGD